MRRVAAHVLLVCTLLASPALATQARAGTTTTAARNPIRKVVWMLQNMTKKVTAEGEKAEELYEKFMCYCKSGVASLRKSIEDASDKIPELQSEIKASKEKLAITKASLKEDENERAAAKATIDTATAMRAKEQAAFDTEKAEYEANLATLAKAITAVEAGLVGSFLQSGLVTTLRKIVDSSKADMRSEDKETVVSFLEGKEVAGYAPSSGEVVGIMKQMSDEMAASLKSIIKDEEAAVKEFNDIVSTKKAEVKALNSQIENKLKLIGNIGVSIVEMKNDLGDSAEALENDKKFLADLETGCSKATEDYNKDQQMRQVELAALADTIKILNDDDALELFKKTLPGSSASSFMQVQVTSEEMQKRALSIIQAARSHQKSAHPRRQLDFMALALHGKKVGFTKVIKMIDEMVATLKKEQADDDAKKEYCAKSLDKADDQKKLLAHRIEDLGVAIDNVEEEIASTLADIKALETGIRQLDKQVAEATEQRKKENAEYKDLMMSNAAAAEILAFAKNRLNKFYNPKLYKPAPKKEVSSEDRVFNNFNETASTQPAPLGGASAAYAKKSEESTGVIQMINLLIADLEKEMTTAETEEKDAQQDYEGFLADSQTKRTEDSKALMDKEDAVAYLQGLLHELKGEKKSQMKDYASNEKIIANLHAECDWILQYFDVRKEARADEIDALGKAKAVLSGADFSLVQMGVQRHLRNGRI